MGLFEKIFGTYSDRELKRIMPIVKEINSFENEISSLSDKELKAKTPYFRELLKNGKTLDDILPEAFAVVREAARRVLGMRHFDVQLIGGIVLHQGRIAEMKTGEGKTLVATLPCYLNALEGKGVHVVTVNDYLAKRDSEQMGKIYRFLGLTVGLVTHDTADKASQYMADITYGTNNEFGFDYLRDNMEDSRDNQVQKKGYNFAIVDEVDSILIDEARTPLIISGDGDESTDLYKIADNFAKRLSFQKIKETDDKVLNEDAECDYIIDEKARTAILTAKGVKKAEETFGIENLSDPENMTISHHINQAIKANGVMKRDIDYVVKDGEVLIVDEFTGRIMIGRRYSEGLHQAIEAKEGVNVERESKTLATITFQNYFRLYSKLSGMTGTAETEEAEFQAIYKLDVVVIPTNKPMIRKDHNDVIYKTEKAKFNAIVEQIKACIKKNQPVLVGTVTIENSEKLSAILKKNGIAHNVLNAKFHEKEAEIISQAGKPGTVTIATNMAGRGTDIMLGGNAEFLAKEAMKKAGFEDDMILEAIGFSETDDEEIINARSIYKELYNKFKEEISHDRQNVIESGGLFIIGTERHESRRIDNQLRGRSGRQGDPGESKFFISFEDDLMRRFGSDRIRNVMDKIDSEENQPLEHSLLSSAIESAQKAVEGRNFHARKNVLEFDDVMNVQRNVIYSQRQNVLDGKNLKPTIEKMIKDFCETTVYSYSSPDTYPDDWNLTGLIEYCESIFLDEGELSFSRNDLEYMTQQSLTETLVSLAMEKYKNKEAEIGEEKMRSMERLILLHVVNEKWMDHIDNMDQLRRGIGLRAYGQKNPVQEYKDEGYQMYEEMIGNIGEDVIRFVFGITLNSHIQTKNHPQNITMSHGADEAPVKTPVKKDKKPGRNDPCPCGSGKKYKKCCGMNE